MTKSIQITFNDVDESVLMTLFKKLKVKTKKIEITEPEFEPEPEPTKAEILEGLKRAVEQMKAHQRGEIKLTSWDEMMSELEADNIRYGRTPSKKATVLH